MNIFRQSDIIALVFFLSSTGSALAGTGTSFRADTGAAELWAVRADSAQAALDKKFWFSFAQIYYSTSARGESWNYWWEAHALDALVMGYRRTRDSFYTGRMSSLYQGIVAAGGFTDSYYDDMEWMALALLRAYEATQKQFYLNEASSLWQTIKGGWSASPGGGGFRWRTTGMYKNVPANAPACILACKLYKDFGDTANLAWAEKIHAWIDSNLVDSKTGIILDGISYSDTVGTPSHGAYTYNYGTYLGASLYLYQITGDTLYLNEAVKEADVADTLFATAGGVLRSEGSGDGGLFKGIYVYYLAKLDLEPALDDSLQTRYKDFLIRNADSLWNHAQRPGTAIFNDDWGQPPSGSVTLSEDLSGVTLLESVAQVFGDTSATLVRQPGSQVPEMFRLFQNYPNPFNPATTIRFDLKEASNVALDIYNVLGQRVEYWNYGMMESGRYSKEIDLSRFASGVYFYSLREDGNEITKEMLLLK